MPRLSFNLTTEVSPERLLGALLDFTERRPELWPSLSKKFYEVRDVGSTSAVVKEGTSGPPFSVWAVERYDWSVPWRVSWTVEESNFCTPGSYVAMTIGPASDGSEVGVEWEREALNLKGKAAISMVTRNDGKMLKGFIRKGFSQLEKIDDLPSYRPGVSP